MVPSLSIADDFCVLGETGLSCQVDTGMVESTIAAYLNQTRDFTPVEPGVEEHKYYAPGIGLILEVKIETGERMELSKYQAGS